MAQSEVIRWVVIAFGGTAVAAALVTWIVLFFLRRKLRAERKEQRQRQSRANDHGVLIGQPH